MGFQAAYLALAARGELAKRAEADEFPDLDRPTTREEYREALAIAARHGLIAS